MVDRTYKAGVDWYFEAAIVDAVDVIPPGKFGASETPYVALTIQLPIYVFGDWKKGDCLLAGEAGRNLLAAGWKLRSKRIGALAPDLLADVFALENTEIGINHYEYYLRGSHGSDDDASCITRINVHTKL
jgi:hypothetical protein